MKILLITPAYPSSNHVFAGTFNEKCAHALNELCDHVEVLVPRPYAPPIISLLVARWKTYARIQAYEVRDGLSIYRPAYLQVPGGAAFWTDPGMFLWCRGIAREMHRRVRFDAIISFDLIGTGGTAWRIGRDLGIPATGWAFGHDVRFPASSSFGKIVRRAVTNLDAVFYQSHELLGKVAELIGISARDMLANQHVVLPHGIPTPPQLARKEIRNHIRSALGILSDQVVILYVGRLLRAKGTFELLEAVSIASALDSSLMCVMVGSEPAFDETSTLQKKLKETPGLQTRVRILPSCHPDKVWEYLCAADIFVFPSHNEGMPNSLLEAMAMGLPAIAFAIPPVLEVENGTGALVAVPPLNVALFANAILHLSAAPSERVRIGEIGRRTVLHRFMVKKNMAAALNRLAQKIQEQYGVVRTDDETLIV